MSVEGWLCWLSVLLHLGHTDTHSHMGEVEIYKVSTGHLLLLRCKSSHLPTNVTWSRGYSLSLPSGVEVRDGALWFLPVQIHHNGTYTCEERGQGGSWEMEFLVLVTSEECPDPAFSIFIAQGVRNVLQCPLSEILSLNTSTHIRWLKDGSPIRQRGVEISEGVIFLPASSEEHAGKYTCLVDMHLNGQNYTAARSVQVKINNGARAELQCLAYLGSSEDAETDMYWTVGDSHIEEYPGFNDSRTLIHEGQTVYSQSKLSIPKVLPQFLNVPFCCHIMNPTDRVNCTVWLQAVDHSAIYTSVALCLAAVITTVILIVAFQFLKVDLVLAYRKLLPYFTKQVPDGKLYDAYVSFVHADALSSSETASFVLQLLPEKLEKQQGYSLYIRERDGCPGEAMHDIISATVRRCRRLIIVLSTLDSSSPNGKTEEASLLCDSNQHQLWYDWTVGLHDALIQNDPRVILVEIDSPLDYSSLPESLRHIKRRQGILKWRKDTCRSRKLTKFLSNRHFWKQLRYHMPSVPAVKLKNTF
ncbi:interleukin-1 receptor-like 1 isoform X2 [Thalassophryne amazonica]|uniref:interleukin-1 receptor-like 1 isoform X2 n=1 Tax=Thalassophryne amazonica TaxID=390379 RepID=UPI0014718D00|nr:interleukin-1 receptor-like 1 isoform X2 [Thalassophryne amazonica]